MGGGRPATPLEDVEPAAHAEREGQRGERPDAASEQRPLVGQVGPGAVVEDVGRRDRCVVVDDVDAPSGDRLQMRVVCDRGGNGRAQHLEGGGLVAAQPRREP